MPVIDGTTPSRRPFGAAAMGCALALVAVLGSACAVPDAQPNAASPGADQRTGSGSTLPAPSPGGTRTPGATTTARAHSASRASSTAKVAATTTGGHRTGAAPKDPVPTAVELAALLLAPVDIDKSTWDVLNGSQTHGGPSQHKMCTNQFPSDASWRTRADGTVIRHTDSLRVEQEDDGYAGNAARAAVADFANAFAQCHDYITGSGAGKLVVHIQSSAAPAYGDAATAADETLTSGQATVYAHVVVVAQAHLLLFISVVGDNHDAVVANQDALIGTAVRKAQIKEG